MKLIRNVISKVTLLPIKNLVRREWSILQTTRNRIKMVINTKPLSEHNGFDGGFPIHRYYLEEFLREFSSDTRGHCLELQEDTYTTRLPVRVLLS